MLFPRAVRRETHIDITSLIDVAFLLVIFLVVSTTFIKERGLDLDLPKAKKGSSAKEEALTVEMTDGGKIYFRGDTYTPEALVAALSKAIEESTSKNVVLKADKRAAHGDVVRVMEAAKQAGAKGLSIAVEQSSEEAAGQP